jgi:zinc protease
MSSTFSVVSTDPRPGHPAGRGAGIAATACLLVAALLLVAGCGEKSPPVVSEKPAPTVYEKVLDNGLKIVVRPDHRAPVVVSQIWYKVGSSYEPEGLTGISHVLEHMMFKGTEKHGPNEFSRIIAENGGRENAFTGRDYTAYFQRLEKSRLPIAFELEADRMRNLVLDPKEVAKETQVVMEERRLRTEDQPESLTFERFMATAYKVHPYHHPVIGWIDDLKRITPEDLRKWYERWYAPNNATLVVVGDVEPGAVFELARKYFGPLHPSMLEPDVPPAEPAQTAEREVRVAAPAEVPYLLMGFHVPVLTTEGVPDWEPYALEVLANILDGGNSARLTRDLVRGRQLAAAAGAGYDLTARSPVLFMIDANPANGHTVGEVEQALLEEIDKLKHTPVTDEELARVKAQAVASNVYERDSVFYQAMKLGQYETVGLDWHLIDDYVDRIRGVTAQQVEAVAQKYLNVKNMTVAVLDPQPIDRAHPPRTPGGPINDVR